MSHEPDKNPDERVIETGWESFYGECVPEGVSEGQARDMRACFFAGASFLFRRITGMMDPGVEPTNGDLARMESIDRELAGFHANAVKQIISALPAQQQRFGDAPIEPVLHTKMHDLGRVLDRTLNGNGAKKTWAFALLVAPFLREGRCSYISNAQRDDVVTLMKEQVARFEGAPDVSGHA